MRWDGLQGNVRNGVIADERWYEGVRFVFDVEVVDAKACKGKPSAKGCNEAQELLVRPRNPYKDNSSVQVYFASYFASISEQNLCIVLNSFFRSLTKSAQWLSNNPKLSNKRERRKK